ncbi:MAG TPA: hypothetical protein DDY20_07590 [Desulfobulbaceae bacterium]|nr:hypothetical protein [Desulfobulbaceae bacterium]
MNPHLIRRIVLCCLCAVLVSGQARALTYPTGFNLVQVPDPLAATNPEYPLDPLPVPSVGQPFFDHHFGTILTRATQSFNLRHEYSRFDPFNADQSLIILHEFLGGDFAAYRTNSFPFDTAANRVTSLFPLDEPRWDPTDPNTAWGLERDGFKILKMNVQNGQFSTVKDFASDSTLGPIISDHPDLYRITSKNEGESSADKRYWTLGLQGSDDDYRLQYLFCWDRQLDQVVGVLPLSKDEAALIDWVGMSPLGNWVLIGGDSGSGNTAGLTMADRQLTTFHQLAASTAHSDIGLDSQGREVIVMQNTATDFIDLIPIALDTVPVTDAGGYAASAIIPLIRLNYAGDTNGFQGGVHISCNCSGYCLVSTYTAPDLPEQNWLDRTIVLARLNRSKPAVWYLAKVHNSTGSYWEETQATISNNGKKVVWASNWGNGAGSEQVFVMQLDMPPLPGEPPKIKSKGLPWSILLLGD